MKSHPALQDQPGKPPKPKVEYNTLLDELGAMAVYGFEDYWKAGRQWQALMVSALTVRNIIQTFVQYDSVDHSKDG